MMRMIISNRFENCYARDMPHILSSFNTVKRERGRDYGNWRRDGGKCECFTADSKISLKHSELLSFSGRADVMCIVCDNSAKHNSNTITLHLFPIGAGEKRRKKRFFLYRKYEIGSNNDTTHRKFLLKIFCCVPNVCFILWKYFCELRAIRLLWYSADVW